MVNQCWSNVGQMEEKLDFIISRVVRASPGPLDTASLPHHSVFSQYPVFSLQSVSLQFVTCITREVKHKQTCGHKEPLAPGYYASLYSVNHGHHFYRLQRNILPHLFHQLFFSQLCFFFCEI